jgi:hypothetical protein
LGNRGFLSNGGGGAGYKIYLRHWSIIIKLQAAANAVKKHKKKKKEVAV